MKETTMKLPPPASVASENERLYEEIGMSTECVQAWAHDNNHMKKPADHIIISDHYYY